MVVRQSAGRGAGGKPAQDSVSLPKRKPFFQGNDRQIIGNHENVFAKFRCPSRSQYAPQGDKQIRITECQATSPRSAVFPTRSNC